MRPKIVVEGTVGAGKTTFIEVVSKRLGLKPLFELTDEKLVDLLACFYADPAKWGFHLQIYFLTKRFQQMELAKQIGDVVMDRSIFCDHIFPTVLLKRKQMNQLEYEIYREVHREFLKYSVPPSLMVYLRCSTRTAIERIKKRGREWELAIDEDYWYSLNEEYERYFSDYDLSSLLIIDSDSMDEDFLGAEEAVIFALEAKEKGVWLYDGNEIKRRNRCA
ncbi:MAG: deoxynucleoside kinase [Thermotoga caldifontis]|uniref:deoxynucleoside kinase n=1 Tax=Thermotoga caldifontis TaxID=1508419 RepID=UPI003C7B6AEF